jgi:hypothetical protein
LEARAGDIQILQSLPFAAISPNAKDYRLLVARILPRLEANPLRFR